MKCLPYRSVVVVAASVLMDENGNPTYLLIPSTRHMKPGRFYGTYLSWGVKAWHRDHYSGPLGLTPEMVGIVRFYIYHNNGKQIVCPKVSRRIPW